MENIVLDTNSLVVSVSRKSRNYIIWKKFIDGEYVLCVTTEILEEYSEILSGNSGKSGWRFILSIQKTESHEDGFRFLSIAFGDTLIAA